MVEIDSPIGVFDSGLGGLTVAKRLLEKLPRESIAYFGDEIHIPYGERTPEDIQGFALGICKFFLNRNAKLIIMACNVSSATALAECRAQFPDVPIMGVIDAGVRAVLRESNGGPVGVLATTGTVKTKAYTKTIQRFAPEMEVYEQACPKFVPIVESGMWDTAEAENAVREYTAPLLDNGCRSIILGCTHYPFLAGMISQVAGKGVTLVDPSEETATEAANILLEIGKFNLPGEKPVHSFMTSANRERLAALGSQFLGRSISEVEQITWERDLRVIPCQEKTAETTNNCAPLR